MSKDFFVMLQTQNGGYTPMTDDPDDLAKFETEEQAIKSAKNSVLGEAFGFAVFDIADGSFN